MDMRNKSRLFGKKQHILMLSVNNKNYFAVISNWKYEVTTFSVEDMQKPMLVPPVTLFKW